MKIPLLIQKNKVLVGIVFICFIVSCYLIFQDVSVHQDVQRAMEEIEQENLAVQQINSKKNPNPVTQSSRLIKQNTIDLQLRIVKLQRCIGNPYREYLLAFLSDLESPALIRTTKADVAAVPVPEEGKKKDSLINPDGSVSIRLTEDEIIKLFAAVYQDYYADRKNQPVSVKDNDILVSERNEIFANFRNAVIRPPEDSNLSEEETAAYTKAALVTFNTALKRFQDSVALQTLETIDQVDTAHILMHSLGLPRTMDRMTCKNYVDEIMTNIVKDPAYIPGLVTPSNAASGSDQKTLQAKISQLTYSYNNMLPPPDNVVAILRHYQILEDLFRRLREAKVRALDSLSSPLSPVPTGSLFGDPIPDIGPSYKKFSYQIVIHSTLPEIREFINKLHEGFRQNRIYDIRGMGLTKLINEVKDANFAASSSFESAKKEESQLASDEKQSSPIDPAAAAKRKKIAEEMRMEEIFANPNYGSVCLGSTELVKARISFNYIMYMGDVLVK